MEFQNITLPHKNQEVHTNEIDLEFEEALMDNNISSHMISEEDDTEMEFVRRNTIPQYE